jgi:hypothetical protein
MTTIGVFGYTCNSIVRMYVLYCTIYVKHQLSTPSRPLSPTLVCQARPAIVLHTIVCLLGRLFGLEHGSYNRPYTGFLYFLIRLLITKCTGAQPRK